MNRIISDRGSSSDVKKLRQLSVVHWCHVVRDFHGVTSLFRRPDLQALVLRSLLHGGPAESIDEPCARKPPPLGLLPDRRPASACSPPRYGPLQDGPHGPSHSNQHFLAYSKFPIYSNGTKTGTLHFEAPHSATQPFRGIRHTPTLTKRRARTLPWNP